MFNPNISFTKASIEHREAVLKWLLEPHVQEFWDNSPEHRDDIIIFMEGRKQPSPYWDGMFDYWIGLVDGEPYCLLMTSEIFPDESTLPAVWKSYLSQTGKTFSIDFMIGNTKYLGKGLAGPTLDKFAYFIHEVVDQTIDTFFIDPSISNPRARHVYEKGGFETVATFNRNSSTYFLMVKKISQKNLSTTVGK